MNATLSQLRQAHASVTARLADPAEAFWHDLLRHRQEHYAAEIARLEREQETTGPLFGVKYGSAIYIASSTLALQADSRVATCLRARNFLGDRLTFIEPVDRSLLPALERDGYRIIDVEQEASEDARDEYERLNPNGRTF